MGCFSWMYADLDNKKPLGEGMRAYIPCPDGTVIYEPGYELHGEFGGEDVYGLVASWNRLYLAMHPYFLIPQHRRIPVEDGTYKYAQPIPVFKFPWYKHYQDLSLTEDQVCKRWEEEMRKWDPEYPVELCEWRAIGIDIACYNDQNR